jgi:hypothetical protein
LGNKFLRTGWNPLQSEEPAASSTNKPKPRQIACSRSETRAIWSATLPKRVHMSHIQVNARERHGATLLTHKLLGVVATLSF